MSWLWLAGPIILAAAAGGIFLAVQNPAFVYGFGKEFLRDLIIACIPLFKRKSPEEEAKDHKAYSQNEAKPTQFNRHPGEH